MQKLWVKRAKRRRVLAEVEQSAAGGDSQGPESLMQEVWAGGGESRVCFVGGVQFTGRCV